MACERCDNGKVRYKVAPSGLRVVGDGDGVVIEDLGGSGTRACACVRDLPEVDEQATWWESETVWQRVHAIPIFDERIEIQVDAEVPRTDSGRRAVMRGNRYYPALISVEQPPSLTLSADDARDYALALLAAAEAAAAIDDPCGDCWAKGWPAGTLDSGEKGQ
jgi:hypothetical protein